MNVAWGLHTGPELEPMLLAAAKLQLRMGSDTTEDAAVTRRIQAARAQGEQYTHRGWLTQTWRYTQDEWADEMQLPMAAPLQSITSVKYYDASGVQQTLSSSVYHVDTLSEPGRITLAPLQTWPVLQAGRAMAIEIVYVVGWTAAALIPPDIVEGFCLLLGDAQLFRESQVTGTIAAQLPNGAEAKLAPHRVWWTHPDALTAQRRALVGAC